MEGPEGVIAQLAWMKSKARAAPAALLVDKYRPTDPDKLVS